MLSKLKGENTDSEDKTIGEIMQSFLGFIVLFLFFLVAPTAFSGLIGDGDSGYDCGGTGADYDRIVCVNEKIGTNFCEDLTDDECIKKELAVCPLESDVGSGDGRCFIDIGDRMPSLAKEGSDAGINKVFNQILDVVFLIGLLGSLAVLGIKFLRMRVNACVFE